MLNNKKILIALGSFKDVFSPAESQNLIKKLLLEYNCNLNITTISIADGGEYSHDVVKSNFDCVEVNLKNIISSNKKKVNSGYLLLDSNTAFISSSHILRLNNDDKSKNPLQLTSFGLGQLIRHAVTTNKVSTIYVGLGGTNTVDGGIGMLQALGTIFLDKSGEYLEPTDGKFFSGCDLKNIEAIEENNIRHLYQNINIFSLCDGNIGIKDMHTPNNQKIGFHYNNDRNLINQDLVNGINKYISVISNYTNERDIKNGNFYGVAGGINISLCLLFNLEMSLGINFFIEALQIEKQIKLTDLVITGEGRFDNSLGGKAPVGISQLAKKYNKEVLYLVGDVSNDFKEYFEGNIASDLPHEIKINGISAIVSCHNFNKDMDIPIDQLDKENILKKNTEIVFKKSIPKFLNIKKWSK